MRLIGRDQELAELDAAFAQASTGRLRCVLLLADPGVGKTRLAQEVLERHARAAMGLAARAHPLSGSASFGLWAEALERHLRDREPDEVRALCDGLDDLAGLLRSVAVARGTEARSAPVPSRPRVLDGLGALVAELARERPLIVVLDDVHQADPSSWDVLHYLADHPVGAGLLVIAIARTGALTRQPEAMRVLLDLEQQGALQRMVLNPLSDPAVGELAREVLGPEATPEVVDALVARSRGNAFFALGLLQALAGPHLAGEGERPGALPEVVVEAVRTRVLGVEPLGREVLELLAVAGDRLELSEIARLTTPPLADLALALERLVDMRLLVEERVHARWGYEIAHPLIEETIRHDLGAARRLVIHRLLGRALLARGQLAEAAAHFAHSAEAGDDEAIEVVQGALAEADRRGAYREGVTLLGVLGDLLPAGDDRWATVAEELPHWMFDHRADGDTGTAAAALSKIDALPQAHLDTHARAVIKGRLVTTLAYGTGDVERAAREADEAIALFERAGDRAGALRAAIERAYIGAIAGDIRMLVQGAERVLGEAGAEDSVLEAALGGLSSGRFVSGDVDGAEEAVDRALEVARRLGDPYRILRHAMSLGWILGYSGDLPGAYAAFEQARAADPGWRQSIVLGLEAEIRWLAGDLAGAVRCAEEGVLTGLSLRRGLAAVVGALAGAETDGLGEARRALVQARGVYGGRRDWFYVTDQFRHAEGMLAWRDGRLDAARVELERSAQNLLAMNAPALAPPVLVDLVELCAELGDADGAAAASDRLAEVAALVARPLYDGFAALAQAWAALAGGALEQGERRGRDAAEWFGTTGYLGYQARALAAEGAARQRRDPARVDGLRAAAAAFNEIGATWRRDRVLERLRSVGAAGRRAAATALGADAFTAREWEVARLAAQRLTAQEIGELLIVSRRTVESHRASIYSKLDVHSKGELMRALAERGDHAGSTSGSPSLAHVWAATPPRSTR
jgi:DNA-binding CsgD family transcriptional regulator/tetratricopeptide (TPR) repeat protein